MGVNLKRYIANIITGCRIIFSVLMLLFMKRFVAEHTMINKITGFVLFLLPLTFSYVELKYSAAAVCIIATVAAIFEWNCIRKRIEV